MSGNLQVYNGQIDTLNSNSVTTYRTDAHEIGVRTLRPHAGFSEGSIVLNFAKTSRTVEISQSGISNDDFIRILREKLLLTVDIDDPLYLQAVARMVTNDPS